MVEESEEQETSARPSHWPHWLGEKFSWANLIVFAVSESVGGTLCIAAAEAFVHREWIAVGLGWGPGLPLVIFGLAFPFRGHLMRPETREQIQRQATNWAPVAILAAFAYVAGPQIYQRAIAPSLGVNQLGTVPGTEDKAQHDASDQIATLQAKLTDAQKNLAAEKQKFGIGLTTNFVSRFGLSDDVKKIPKTFVVVTADPNNQIIAHEIEEILNVSVGIGGPSRSHILPIGLPNYQKDLDAPRLTGVGISGITIHGRNEAGNIFMEAFSNCFATHQVGDTPTAVLDYWKRIYPTTTTDINDITWIDIGPGEAWKGHVCH